MGLLRPGNVRTVRTTNSGLGDIVASAGYNVYAGDALSLDLVGNVKFGTADATKGLGTGQNDYSAQADGYYSFAKTTLFATAGYRIYGEPTGITMKSSPYGTIGTSQKLSDETSAGIMLDVVKSPTTASADQREVTAFVSQKISASTKVQANVMKGYSTGSPDFGFGGMITGYF